MSSSFQTEYLSPKPRRPVGSHLNRAPNQSPSRISDGIGSGRATPVPHDAPPSVHATSSARKTIRAQQKHRLFPTIDYAARVSHFDPKSEHRDFSGFFVLFWVGLAIMVITAMLRNLKETGYPLVIRQWPVLTEKLFELALSDLLMVASSALSLPLHKMYTGVKILRWSRLGMPLQSLFQTAWLLFWVNWPFLRIWSWTSQVFFTLHLLSIFMKMHSYAFYNGHLSTTRRRLNDLDRPDGASRAKAYRYPGRTQRLHDLNAEHEPSKEEQLGQLREDLAHELTSSLGNVTYPQNLTIANYVDFLFCPTLCYELEYPRMPETDFMELFYKTLAVFGCIFLTTLTTEEFVLPVLDESAIRMTGIASFSEGFLIMAESISRLLFPFMVLFLLVFLIIFEYVLGAFAEITRFADRQFYSDWWNSCDWLEFSREWNIPVHHFFRRHVYVASRIYVSKSAATGITFLVSALAHELVMGCITKKLRGYGFTMMMLQMPIVMIQRSRLLRGRTLLNNVLFWCSMILGLSMICALYVLL
ncbi:hypothetical protein EJ05DRAFT_476238 [Pseudovirgaria hyperparasitica]|uniref:O-acyltransferase n=1 Tax=Pseudovirgaria hyperparasitica TaxID=470096 RepID=A0A6A6W4U0_9PEZI|nr:uncharacterized protein EJ05DRAFT_476238 [Pseudovirgaria hyperparasitica]KAF2757948.1 hypothetical protein EJ05DRAFT_476238 [Pseudovirgaria hyperparasitica]